MSDEFAAAIEAAQRDETIARAQLAGTLRALQARLAPKSLARDGARKVADAGQSAAREGLEAVRRNPAPLAGIAAIGALFIARERIAGMFRRKPPIPRHPSRKDKSHD